MKRLIAVLIGTVLSTPPLSSEEQLRESGYGLDKNHAIRVADLDAPTGPAKERAYLDKLSGPNGELVIYRRLGSCCSEMRQDLPFFEIDIYEVSYEDAGYSVELYINMYESGELKAPDGFVFTP